MQQCTAFQQKLTDRNNQKLELAAAQQECNALAEKIITDSHQADVLGQKLIAHMHQKQDRSADSQKLDALHEELKANKRQCIALEQKLDPIDQRINGLDAEYRWIIMFNS